MTSTPLFAIAWPMLAVTLGGFEGAIRGAAFGQATSCSGRAYLPVETARIASSESVLPLLSIRNDDDSPVAIVSVDFRQAKLLVGGGVFDFVGTFTLTLFNRTDTPVTGIQTIAHVATEEGGAGGGPGLERLVPGGWMSVTGKASGHGTAPNDRVQLRVGIVSANVGTCRYPQLGDNPLLHAWWMVPLAPDRAAVFQRW